MTRDLFEKLMHDKEEHIDFLETQVDLIGRLGLELYAQHHIGSPTELTPHTQLSQNQVRF